jgi:hypothetical protein
MPHVTVFQKGDELVVEVDTVRRRGISPPVLSRPVFGRRLDAPDVAPLIQRQSKQPKLLILPNPDTVHYPRSDSGSSRETL